jgi:hypothetical protein
MSPSVDATSREGVLSPRIQRSTVERLTPTDLATSAIDHSRARITPASNLAPRFGGFG